MADIHLGEITGTGPARTIEVFYHIPGPTETKTLTALTSKAEAVKPLAPETDLKETDAMAAGTLLEVREVQSYGEDPAQIEAAHAAMRARWKQLAAEQYKRLESAYASYGTTLSAKT